MKLLKCLTHIQSSFRYKFGAQLFVPYQMIGDGVGGKLPSKLTFKTLRRLSQQDDIFGEASGTLLRHLMISPAFLALHIPIPPAIVNSLVPSAALNHGPYISLTTPELAATFLTPHRKEPFAQISSLRLISLEL